MGFDLLDIQCAIGLNFDASNEFSIVVSFAFVFTATAVRHKKTLDVSIRSCQMCGPASNRTMDIMCSLQWSCSYYELWKSTVVQRLRGEFDTDSFNKLANRVRKQPIREWDKQLKDTSEIQKNVLRKCASWPFCLFLCLFEQVCDLPVRCARFIARKNWVVAGSDDMQVSSSESCRLLVSTNICSNTATHLI